VKITKTELKSIISEEMSYEILEQRLDLLNEDLRYINNKKLLKEGFLDAAQGVLDLVGLIPGAGEIADAINGVVSLLRALVESEGKFENVLNAIFSFISMVPAIGDAVGKGGKLGIYFIKILDKFPQLKKAGDLINAAKSNKKLMFVVTNAKKFFSDHGDKVVGVVKALQEKDVDSIYRIFNIKKIKNERVQQKIDLLFEQGLEGISERMQGLDTDSLTSAIEVLNGLNLQTNESINNHSNSITKSKLRQIIREELNKQLHKEGIFDTLKGAFGGKKSTTGDLDLEANGDLGSKLEEKEKEFKAAGTIEKGSLRQPFIDLVNQALESSDPVAKEKANEIKKKYRSLFIDPEPFDGNLSLYSGKDLSRQGFKGKDLRNVNFSKSDLQNANFENAIFSIDPALGKENYIFSGSDITGANFKGIRIYVQGLDQSWPKDGKLPYTEEGEGYIERPEGNLHGSRYRPRAMRDSDRKARAEHMELFKKYFKMLTKGSIIKGYPKF